MGRAAGSFTVMDAWPALSRRSSQEFAARASTTNIGLNQRWAIRPSLVFHRCNHRSDRSKSAPEWAYGSTSALKSRASDLAKRASSSRNVRSFWIIRQHALRFVGRLGRGSGSEPARDIRQPHGCSPILFGQARLISLEQSHQRCPFLTHRHAAAYVQCNSLTKCKRPRIRPDIL